MIYSINQIYLSFETLTHSKTTDYIGNKVYENYILNRILVEGGYIQGGKYYFYQSDHLGNNRVVLDANGGCIEDSHYYPFGMAFGAQTSTQPYKYNGKELDQMHGLNQYDYSARYYEPAIGRFTTVDPLAEKYYRISPYAYVANNPIKFIDPTGMSYTYNWNTNEYEYTDGDGNTRKAEWDEVKKDIDKNSNAVSALASLKGIANKAAESVMDFFSIKNTKTTPDGEVYNTYTQRNYENSGPDYLGVSFSGAVPNGLLFFTNTEWEMNIGYLKNDGWVIFPSFKQGTGFNLSISGQITTGWYLGNGLANAKSLNGYGIYTNYSRGMLSTSIANGLDDQNNISWMFMSVGIGKGLPKSLKWSTQTGVSYTPETRYLRNFSIYE